MKIAAENGEFNPFFVQPDGLARVNTPQGYRLMDQNGAIVQARLGDAMPLASMQRLVVEDRDGSRSVMVDMQGREIARFNKTYSVDASTASEGVVVYEGDNGRHGFVNAEGKRVVGPYFNKLGPLRDGLRGRGASSAAASCTATSTSPAATPSRPRSPGPTISARAAPWRGVATSSCTSTRAARPPPRSRWSAAPSSSGTRSSA